MPNVRANVRSSLMSARISAVIICLGLSLHALAAEAATISIDCDTGASITKAISGLKTGDTLVVSGTCRESVLIPPDAVGITLDGQGKATIQHLGGVASGPAAHGIYVRGRAITITGFTVKGAVDGIHLSGPAHAVIDGNVVLENRDRGIHVDKGSIAQIARNTVRNNGGAGINVTEQSYARIGFLIPPDERPRPNTIQNNGGSGIHVDRGSNAWIVGNTISRNAGAGVTVDRNSHADVVGNAITGNGGDGIAVTHNSGVNFASEGTARREGPNETDSADRNGSAGVRCSVGGYVRGPLGTLTGKRGAKEIDRTCVDRAAVP
jgi:parallel beta-helix repeat protein